MRIRSYIIIILWAFSFSPVFSTEIDSLQTLLKQDSIKNDKLKLYELYSDLSFFHKAPEQKIIYADSAFYYADQLNLHVKKAEALVLKSTGLIEKSELSHALEALLGAAKIYDEYGIEDGYALALSKIGNVYLDNNELEKAEGYYLKAIGILDRLNDPFYHAAVYTNVGEVYRKWDKPYLAIDHFNKGLSIFTEMNYLAGIAYAEGNIGLVYVDINKTDSARIKLNKAIKILEPIQDNYAISSYLEGLSMVSVKEGEWLSAEALALKSLKLATKHGIKGQVKESNLLLSKIYDQQKQYKKAHHHLQAYISYRDSLNNEETIRRIANLKAEYDVSKKQKEVDKFKSREQYYITLGVLLFVITSLLIFITIYQYRVRMQKKNFHKTLVSQHRKLQDADQSKSRFFQILSHDLRNPIATFISYTEVLKHYLDTEDYSEVVPLVNEMEKSASGLHLLLDNLLQWGVIQMKNVQINKTNINLSHLVEEELYHISSCAKSKGVLIETNIPQNLIVRADKPFLAMTLRNLLSNSFKFTPSGGQVNVTVYSKYNKIFMQVKDTGVGFDLADFNRKRNQNKLESTLGTSNEKGLGLGLQLVFGFAETHNVHINVKSSPGKGACFTLVFNS